MKNNKKKKGFTLVELIAVIAILGILAAVIVPRVSSYNDRANYSKEKANAQTILNATELYNSVCTGGVQVLGSTSMANITATPATNGASNLQSDDDNAIGDLKNTVDKIVKSNGLINSSTTITQLQAAVTQKDYKTLKLELPAESITP